MAHNLGLPGKPSSLKQQAIIPQSSPELYWLSRCLKKNGLLCGTVAYHFEPLGFPGRYLDTWSLGVALRASHRSAAHTPREARARRRAPASDAMGSGPHNTGTWLGKECLRPQKQGYKPKGPCFKLLIPSWKEPHKHKDLTPWSQGPI